MRARVLLYGESVGIFTVESGNPTFRFAPGYLAAAPRPVLGRWFEDRTERLGQDFRHIGTQGALPSFFGHYLPEAGSALRTPTR
ncbi:MAG: HipA N-terminal domain-containing protein [Deltaproteobacteria bacterium]|nr:HipA N-terminal domain-containing protein [Deltaproteobacteria bacterium]